MTVMVGMVSRARLCYTKDYLTASFGKLIKLHRDPSSHDISVTLVKRINRCSILARKLYIPFHSLYVDMYHMREQ